MIILKTEKDIQKLKKWDIYLVQEILDILKKNETNEDVFSVHEQINKIQSERIDKVNKHIEKLDEKFAEEYNRKLNEKTLRTIVDLPVIWPKSVLKLSENWINTIEDVKNNIDLVFKLLKLSKEDQLKLSSAL